MCNSKHIVKFICGYICISSLLFAVFTSDWSAHTHTLTAIQAHWVFLLACLSAFSAHFPLYVQHVSATKKKNKKFKNACHLLPAIPCNSMQHSIPQQSPKIAGLAVNLHAPTVAALALYTWVFALLVPVLIGRHTRLLLNLCLSLTMPPHVIFT